MIARALELVAATVALFPFRWLRALGAPLAWLVGSVLRIRRSHVEASLERSGVVHPAAEARAMYRSLGASVMEILWSARRPVAELERVCSLEPASAARLARARARGKGLVLAASHTGNWELAACAMARALALSVLVKPLSVGGVASFVTRARQRHGLGLLSGEGALEAARQAVKRGESVAVLIDQVPARGAHGERIAFLGERALVDRGAAALASATGAPLVVVAFRRDDAGHHEVQVLDVIEPPPRGRREWTREATLRATRALEAFVLAHPSQWLWMHRRWAPPRGEETPAAACQHPPATLEERHV